ncbi:PilZ domain-containing protein [Calidifontibacillus oryziterrae]|uniref:PilZ domain-containing protein n=1 Tax=Calidifontibacillus oryziterrae TaxID=1191699 RepID=UPI0002FD8A1E|nr:PilZ domain-containing protein [Calidifontibacillus oryziterrae]
MDYIKLIKDDEYQIGALYKFEGELMKITVKDPDVFRAGDQIYCSYSDILFDTKILKKEDYQLYVLVPQTNEHFPHEKRKHPRIKVDLEGTLLNYYNYNKADIKVIDISRDGFGILMNKKEKQIFSVGDVCEIKIAISDNPFAANLQIRNNEVIDQAIRLGCELHSISSKDEFELRKFILAEQLKSNMAY